MAFSLRLGTAVFLLSLSGCGGPNSLTEQEAQASNVVWCNSGTPLYPIKRDDDHVPASRARACWLAAGSMVRPSASASTGELSLIQKACDLDDAYCLLFAQAVDRGMKNEASRVEVPVTAIEAVYRLCADNKPLESQGQNTTPEICWDAAQIASTLNNTDHAQAFDNRSCEAGDRKACHDLQKQFGDTDAEERNQDVIASYEANEKAARETRAQSERGRPATEEVETRSEAQTRQDSNRNAAIGEFLGGFARGAFETVTHPQKSSISGAPSGGTTSRSIPASATATSPAGGTSQTSPPVHR